MRNILMLVLFAVSVAAVAAEPNHKPAVPEGAELARFPTITAPMVPKTAKQQVELEAKLGLKPVALAAPIRAFNDYRRDGSWRYEEIAAGTIVLVDGDSKIRYKADCWNRLVLEPTLLESILAALKALGDKIGSGGLGILLALIGAALMAAMLSMLRPTPEPIREAPRPIPV